MVNKPKRQKFKKEYSAKLFRIAENDLYVADFLTTAPKCRPELILYQAQQAVEKSIKAVLVFQNKSVPLTHDIQTLCAELDASDSAHLPEGAAELSQFAIAKRYTEGDEIFDQHDLKSAIEIGKIFIEWARNKIVF